MCKCEACTGDEECEVKPSVIPKIPARCIIAGAVVAVALIMLAVLAWKKLIKLPF